MKRRGFSLIELLVVVAILAVLLALLLAAIQKVREAANRIRCTDHLRQIGLALHNYHNSLGVFPSGSPEQIGYLSPQVQLLPYLEQDAVHDIVDMHKGPFDAANQPAAAVRVPIFLCPSEGQRGTVTYMGWTNYHANSGTWAYARGWDGVFGPNYTVSGVPPLLSVRLEDITDGTAHTAAFSEVVNGLYGIEPPPHRLADCFEFGAPPGKDVAAAQAAFLAKDWQTAQIPWDGTWRYRGYPWTEGTIWRGWYNHLLTPQSTCWRPNDWWLLVTPATSYHGAGVNVLFCDGSVRFVSSRIAADAWLAAGTRNGGESALLP
jgi:prepilin-type N-terminal cleavage/methylation domain-containing protein/prepilin-type processing-associated H-X9-DG protein